MTHLNESKARDTKAIRDIADILDKTLIEDKKPDALADPSMENKVTSSSVTHTNESYVRLQNTIFFFQIKLWMNEAYSKSMKNATSGNDSDLGMTTDEIDGLDKEDKHTGIYLWAL